ncbi:LysR family transcriptional regulator [Sphingobacterium sp. Mn56C]|uniref:LysR family transcriptional regulator n=1 Tax=Sphingobacterium sp. Mn56C TaxID=3395261 RepID=UPI003BEDC68B
MQGNLEWFRTFRMVYELGTMSGAAKALHISQPGVGLHLNALELYTGFPLFERTARKMIPTERGKLLYQQLFGALDCLLDIEMRFQKKGGPHKATVAIGMCVETFQQILEKHIPFLNFNLSIQFDSDAVLLQRLEQGALDLVLTGKTRAKKGLEFTALGMEKLILAAGKHTDIRDFQTANTRKLQQWLKGQRWYATAADMEVLNRFWEINFNSRPDFVPNFIVPNKFSINRCLSIGEGLAVLPDFLCNDAIKNGDIIPLWQGYQSYEKPLFLGKRSAFLFKDEVQQLEEIFIESYQQLVPLSV